MPHVKGRPKRVWTGHLAADVQEGSQGDDRLCWLVVLPWGEVDQFFADLNAIAASEAKAATAITEWNQEEKERLWALVSRYVRGWDNYLDENGKPVPWSLEEFLQVDVGHIQALFARMQAVGEQATSPKAT